MTKEHLVLTGFMGVGKSTVGPQAADVLGVRYYDTDDWMETETGIDVPQLVKSNITAFRKAEANALEAILDREPGIISTGGGIVSTEIGRNALRAAGCPVVWLRAPFDDSAKRVAEDNGRERPLFADTATALKLYDERAQWYAKTSDHIVDATQPIELVVGGIVAIAQTKYRR